MQFQVGFRPEAVQLGEDPLPGKIRTVEDLGSEVFVHLLVDHQGSTTAVVAKVPAPFHGHSGGEVALRLAGRGHMFDPSGPRLGSGQIRIGA